MQNHQAVENFQKLKVLWKHLAVVWFKSKISIKELSTLASAYFSYVFFLAKIRLFSENLIFVRDVVGKRKTLYNSSKEFFVFDFHTSNFRMFKKNTELLNCRRNLSLSVLCKYFVSVLFRSNIDLQQLSPLVLDFLIFSFFSYDMSVFRKLNHNVQAIRNNKFVPFSLSLFTGLFKL